LNTRRDKNVDVVAMSLAGVKFGQHLINLPVNEVDQSPNLQPANGMDCFALRYPEGMVGPGNTPIWKRRSMVVGYFDHAFRTVVNDIGANLGYVISDSGFQSGARDAAANANIRLMTWKEFQAELFDRWFSAMENRLTAICDLIYDLKETGENRFGDRTLMDAALKSGGEEAVAIWNFFEHQYVQFLFAWSKIGAHKF